MPNNESADHESAEDESAEDGFAQDFAAARVFGVPDRIVVVGASAGGVAALRTLVGGLAPGFAGAVLVVQHIGAYPSILPELLGKSGGLPATHAEDGARILPGRIYVAPPDHHLLVDGDRMRLTRGPKEHHSRPAIDPLFRSAALFHGTSVIGVVLTGHLDDGTAGLHAVKACGGIAIVQEPGDALEPSMPRSVLNHVEVDHCLPLDQIAETLTRLLDEGIKKSTQAPAVGLANEHALSVTTPSEQVMHQLRTFAEPSTWSCPDCGGALWEIRQSRPVRFRCHTGHAFTLRTLAHTMRQTTELTLWAAIRAMQEEAMLLRAAAQISRDSDENDLSHPGQEAAALESGAARADANARSLQRMVEESSVWPSGPVPPRLG